MNYWLMKSEPTSFSIEALEQAPKSTTHWDGVRNFQARNFIRDDMRVGDLAFFYYSNYVLPGIVGVMEIKRAAYPDFTALDVNHDHYDPKSTQEKPQWYMVDVKFVRRFPNIISLTALRNNPALKEMLILRKGNRLSVTPVRAKEWKAVMEMACHP